MTVTLTKLIFEQFYFTFIQYTLWIYPPHQGKSSLPTPWAWCGSDKVWAHSPPQKVTLSSSIRRRDLNHRPVFPPALTPVQYVRVENNQWEVLREIQGTQSSHSNLFCHSSHVTASVTHVRMTAHHCVYWFQMQGAVKWFKGKTSTEGYGVTTWLSKLT